MEFELHFVNRLSGAASPALAESLLARGGPDRRVRVVETFTPSQGSYVADLALSERDLPEVLSAMHEATEIHAHGLPPKLAVRLIPYVKPVAVEKTPLVLHGPWAPLLGEFQEDATRFQQWPGPVRHDAAARRCLDDDSLTEGADVAEDCSIDPSDPALLPRPGGACPLPGEQGRRLACITLDADLPDAAREALAARLAELDGEDLQVFAMDESTVAPFERATVRRHSQATIAAGPGRIVAEAACQGVPVFVLDPPPDANAESIDERAVARVLEQVGALRDRWRATAT